MYIICILFTVFDTAACTHLRILMSLVVVDWIGCRCFLCFQCDGLSHRCFQLFCWGRRLIQTTNKPTSTIALLELKFSNPCVIEKCTRATFTGFSSHFFGHFFVTSSQNQQLKRSLLITTFFGCLISIEFSPHPTKTLMI